MTDPLAELLAHLERDGRVPLAWVVAHAPGGDSRPAWEASNDAKSLAAIALRVRDRQKLVRAIRACARSVVHHVPPHEARPAAALDEAAQRALGRRGRARLVRRSRRAERAGRSLPACPRRYHVPGAR